MLSLPGGLSLEQVFLFTKLCSVLKDDILLVQPSRIPANEAPSVLSPLLLGFLGHAVGVPQTSAAEAWKHLKDDIWMMSRPVLSKDEKGLFRMHGSKVGLSAYHLLFPAFRPSEMSSMAHSLSAIAPLHERHLYSRSAAQEGCPTTGCCVYTV